MNVVKWKGLGAIMIGLLVVSSSLSITRAKSFSFDSKAVGIYDPHPVFGDDLRDAVPLLAELYVDVHKGAGYLKGTVFMANKTFPIKKRFSLIQSKAFDGYTMIFNNNPNDKLMGLQGNIYKNGTVFLFFEDKRGGLLFIQMYDLDIVSNISKLDIPRKNIDENEWLWKLGSTLVKTKIIKNLKISAPHAYRVFPPTPNPDWTSSTFVTKWFEVGWWRFKTKYFITLELRVHGPPYITHTSPQRIYQVEVKIHDEGTKSKSEETPLLIGDIAQFGPEAVEMGMVVPECDRIIEIYGHTASRYAITLGDVGLSFGFALGPTSLDPITAISLVLSGGLHEEIEPTHPVNAVHIKYNDMYALHPGEYIGTKDIVVEYQYQQYSGVKPLKVKFKVPVYYQLSASQGLRKVGVIEGEVYHYVNHGNTP